MNRGTPKLRRSAPMEVVRRKYAEAQAERQANGSWVVLGAPGGVRHVVGRGSTEAEAWGDAAGRCLR